MGGGLKVGGSNFLGGSSIFHLSPTQKVNLVTKSVNFQKFSPAAPTFYLYHSVLKINIEIIAIKRPFSYLQNLAPKLFDMLGVVKKNYGGVSKWGGRIFWRGSTPG